MVMVLKPFNEIHKTAELNLKDKIPEKGPYTYYFSLGNTCTELIERANN